MIARVLLIRHGQTEWNREQRFRGRADIPLDETGLRQARVTAKYVAARWPVRAVYSSPMQRAIQTAEAIAAVQGLEVQLLQGLLDLDFGMLQGQPFADARVCYPDLLRAWFEAPHTVRFPGGEGLDEVRNRCTATLREVVDRHPEQTVAMVAHTVVNRVLLCAVLDLENDHFWHLGQDTCAVNLIEWDGKRYMLRLLNDTSHLWQAD
ncbi:MAG TPA: histidine phosphatase family protein [Chloroflexi bacterium]|nr:histidine phosphatase family protein [Chloroflexota bacterium]